VSKFQYITIISQSKLENLKT